MLKVLTFIGVQSVEYAKDFGTYHDRTGNLRASVGYAVIMNGEILNQYQEGKKAGRGKAKNLMVVLVLAVDMVSASLIFNDSVGFASISFSANNIKSSISVSN